MPSPRSCSFAVLLLTITALVGALTGAPSAFAAIHPSDRAITDLVDSASEYPISPHDVTARQCPQFVTLDSGSIVLYTRDSAGDGLDKYLYDVASHSWTAEGSVSLHGIEDITATATFNAVDLHVATASAVYFLSDATGASSITGLSFTKIEAPENGDLARGDDFSPAPEATVAGLAAIGGIGAYLVYRRSRARGSQIVVASRPRRAERSALLYRGLPTVKS